MTLFPQACKIFHEKKRKLQIFRQMIFRIWESSVGETVSLFLKLSHS